MNMLKKSATVLLACVPLLAWAADPEMSLIIQDHRFTPTELRVPAGKKIRLVIENRDATSEEFESKSLGREKLIAGKSKATVTIGPLKLYRRVSRGDSAGRCHRGVNHVQRCTDCFS